MFGIDRQQGRTVFRHGGGHHLPGGNQRFLVCERHRAALFDRSHHRRQPRASHDGRDRHIDRPRRRLRQSGYAAGAGNLAALQGIAQVGQQRLVRNDDMARSKLARQIGEFCNAAMGGQHFDLPIGTVTAN